MTPIDPQPNHRAAEKPKESASTSPSPDKWTPTQQSYEKLLATFNSDRNEAGKIYVNVRLKLSRYFERNGVTDAEHYIDVTLDRVMRRLDEGEIIAKIMAFIFTVASYVRMEAWNEEKQLRHLENEMIKTAKKVQPEPVIESPQQLCLDRCLAELPVETQKLLHDYYSEEGGAGIRLRRRMAKGLGIGLNALRIRVHRIRHGLETCVKECVSQTV